MPFNNIRFYILIVMVLTITACDFSFNTPEEYFDQAALNTNEISRFGGTYFEGYQNYNKHTSGTNDLNTCKIYLQNSIARAEKNLDKVKKLKRTSATKPMIDASVDLYTFVLANYRTQHLKIAKMIDNQESEESINQALVELDTKSYDTFSLKYNKLWEFADVYARDNGIEVKKMSF